MNIKFAGMKLACMVKLEQISSHYSNMCESNNTELRNTTYKGTKEKKNVRGIFSEGKNIKKKQPS